MTVQELYAAIGDYEEAKKRLMSDKLIAKFVVKFPADPSYGQLMEAWEKEDSDGIFRAAHTLKGVSANLALTSLFEPVDQITEAYRPGHEERRAEVDLSALIREIQMKYQDTVEAIREYEQTL